MVLIYKMSNNPWIRQIISKGTKKRGEERLNPLLLSALAVGEDSSCTVDHGKDGEGRQLAP